MPFTLLFAHFRHPWSVALETHGPLGTLWVGIGLICFYIALIWLNSLLGVFLTPLFIVPITWLRDKVKGTPKGEVHDTHA